MSESRIDGKDETVFIKCQFFDCRRRIYGKVADAGTDQVSHGRERPQALTHIADKGADIRPLGAAHFYENAPADHGEKAQRVNRHFPLGQLEVRPLPRQFIRFNAVYVDGRIARRPLLDSTRELRQNVENIVLLKVRYGAGLDYRSRAVFRIRRKTGNKFGAICLIFIAAVFDEPRGLPQKTGSTPAARGSSVPE